MIRGRGRSKPFGVPVSKPARLGPEHNDWWWNPSRVGVRGGPADFSAKLAEIDPNLAVTWNPIKERWQIWLKKPELQNPISQGWLLLFPVPPRQLDERVFARLYEASSRKWGSGKAYFDRIEAEIERDRARFDRQASQEARDIAAGQWDYSQIKISMAGKSNGSKFSRYHSE